MEIKDLSIWILFFVLDVFVLISLVLAHKNDKLREENESLRARLDASGKGLIP